MTNTNGWDVVNNEGDFGGSSDREKVEFLPVPIGDTKFRVIGTAPHAYEEYWSNKGNGGKGTSIPYFGKECLLEKENKEYLDKHLAKAKAIKDPDARKKAMRAVYQSQPWKKRQKFAINVIDRSDGQVKVLDKGLAVFRELKKYAQNPEYGDLRGYDVTLNRVGEALKTEYTVIPARNNTPLTPEEEALVQFDIEEFRNYDHVTPEQVLRIAKGEKWEDVLQENDKDEDQDIHVDEAVSVVKKEEDTAKDTNTEKEVDEMLPFPEEETKPKVEEEVDELSTGELDDLDFG